jgi:DNA repair exonuclease SbcCD nuclease subunit
MQQEEEPALDTIHVLHVSDTHLGYRQYGLYERELDIYETWREVIETAIREHVDLVVHSGDLFDTSKPPPQAIREAIRGFRLLHDHGIPAVAVMGDHDVPKRRQLPPNALLDELGLLRTLGLRGGGEAAKIRTRRGVEIHVAGVTNQRGPAARQRLLEHLRRLPRPEGVSLLLIHQTLQEVAPEYELALGELPRGYSYYALGHIHLFKGWRYGDAYAVYPGSPEALRVDEASKQPERYILLAELAPGKTVSLEKLRLKTPRPQIVKEIEFSDIESLKAELLKLRGVLAKYPQERKPLLHLTVHRVPRSLKKSIYQYAEKLLRPLTLSYRLNVETYEEELPRNLRDPGKIDIGEMLRELLRDQTLVELASKIIDIASARDKKTAMIDEVLHEIKKTYGIIDE